MLLHILRKDLRRKRTMNVILLLFIILASMFLAASVSNMIVLNGAVDFFMDVSKIADYFIVAVSETETTPLDEFLANCDDVTEYEVQDTYMLVDDAIEIAYCADHPEESHYERGNTVMIQTVPENFAKVFNSENDALSLSSGEIAIPRNQAEQNALQVGDKLKITCGSHSMEFTIRTIVKDALLGSKMIGPNRIFISWEDYETLTGGEERYHTLFYHINCSDLKAFQKEMKIQNIETSISIEKSTIRMCYFFDILIAGILVIVSICMILISFLILRFTIVFTLQEDYKEIGIMKAIGISDRCMRGLYLLKYFVVALIGSTVGLAFSFPFEILLLSQTMENFVAPPVEKNAVINVLCAVLIIMIVLLFCYACTGKIRKYTAIEAIRNGSNGERYSTGGKIRLYKRKGLPPFVYLACNDVMSNVKRYLVLAVIFCIGTMEILLPLTALHTLKDKNIIRTFNVQPSSLFIDTGDMEKYVVEKDDKLLRSDLEEMKKQLAEHGLDAQVWVELWYSIPFYKEGDAENSITSAYTMQQIGKDEEDYDVLEGSVPLWDNEVMITEKIAKELEVSIGDTVYYRFPEEEKEFLITGIYQSMMNMGYGMRVCTDVRLPYQTLGAIQNIQVQIESDRKEEELKALVETVFPDYEVSGASEWVKNMIGVVDQIDALQLFITVLVLVINALITVLMVKTLLTKERGEIAVLKSIGVADRTIRGWQSMRILVVLSVAIITGTLLSWILGPVTIGVVFSVMGATSIKLVSNSLETFLIYPLLMLVVTGSAAYLCAGAVKKVDLREINTIE